MVKISKWTVEDGSCDPNEWHIFIDCEIFFLQLHICLIFILKSIPVLVGGLVPLPDSLRSTLTDPLRETPYLWVFMLSSGTIKATFSIILQVV